MTAVFRSLVSRGVHQRATFCLRLAAWLVLTLPAATLAQSVVWTGGAGTGSWGTAANWDSDPLLPVLADVVGFDAAAANAQYTVTLGANRAVTGLVFAATGADGFVFAAGNTLTVGASGIVNNHALTQTFDATVATSGTTTWSAASGGLAFADVTLGSNLTLTGSHAIAIGGLLTNSGGSRTLTQNGTVAVTLYSVALSNDNTGRTLTISGTGNTTVTGVIGNGGTGAGNLTKTGAGTLTLEVANTYTGTTTLTTGLTIAGDDAVFGTSLLILNGGTLAGDGSPRTFANDVRLSGNSTLGGASDLTFVSTLTLSANRTLTINNTGATLFGDVALSNSGTNRRLTIAGTGSSTIGGVISNGLAAASSLTKSGTGTLTLTGTNTYSGNTTLSSGTLVVGNDAAFGTSTLTLAAATVQGDGTPRTIANSGTVTGNPTFGGTSALSFAGTLTLTGSRTFTFTNTALTTFADLVLSNSVTSRTLTITGAGDVRVTGVISNGLAPASGLTKSGAGTLTLDGNNTYGGTTTLNAGTLVLNGNNTTTGVTTLTAGTLILGSDTAFGSGGVNLTAATLRGDGTPRVIANTVTLTGNGTLGGASDLSFTGLVTQSANRTLTLANTGLTTFNNLNLSNSATSRTLTLAGTGDLVVNGVVGNGPSTGSNLTMSGSGTVTLNGVNTYAGTTRLNSGTVSIGDETGLGANPVSFNAGRLTFNGGTLATTGTFAIDDVNRGLTILAPGGTLATSAGTTLTVANVITGAGALTKTGDGALVLTRANTYTGATNINAGVVNIRTSTALGTVAGGVTVASGAALELQNGIAIGAEALSLAGTGVGGGGALRNVSGTNSWAGNITLTGATEIQTDADSLTLSGSVTSANLGLSVDGAGNTTLGGVVGLGTGGLTKDGSGTLTLSGANTYTGTTTVNAGTVLATNSSSLGGASGAVTVASGATLALGGGANITKTAMLNLAGDGVSAGAGALQAAGTTGQTSQWAGDITLTGNTTITAADNLLILGDDLNFDNTINLGSYTLTLNTTSGTGVTPTYLPYAPYILDPTNIYITSVITGSGGLTKTGDGTVNLISFPSNSYTGDTVITGGKLIVDGAGNAPVVSSSQVYVGNASGPGAANSVVLQLGQLASSPAANNLVGTYNNLTNLASTSLTVYADGLFNMNGGSNALVNLTLQGGRVTGDNLAYNPLLTVTGGITTLASDQTALIEELNLGMSANAFAFAIADGTTASGIDLQIDAIVQNGIGFTAGNAATSFAKTGDGTLVLTANNVYQGVTDIQQGILNIQSNTALGQVGPFLGSLDNGTVVQSGAQLQLEGGLTISTETLTLNGTGIGNTGALLNLAGDNTYNGFVRLESDSRINAEAGTTLDIANTGGVNATIMNGTAAGRNLTVGGAGDTEINGAIGAFVNTITKDGTGTLTLAGNNAYTGATNVTSGAVKVTHNSGLAGSGATVTSGAALQFAQDAGGNNINAVAVNATIAGTGLANGGAIQNLNGTNSYAGAITLSADARITANSGSALTLSGNVNGAGYDLEAGGQGNTTYSGVISGTGTTFTKTDSGTVTFSGAGANTFTGALTVNEGTLNLNKTAGVNAVGTSNTVIIGDTVGAASSANLVLQANNQMPNTTDVTINSDGRLAMGTFSDEISQLAGTGLLDLGTTGLLTIGGDNSSSVFDGTITGTGTLEKSGTGSLTFNSDISYDGTLELGGGTLVLNDMLLSVDTLTITANSTIDFGAVGNSYLFTETLSFLNTSVTLNIINWSFGVDAFYATFWPGATYDLLDNAGATPMSQITFDGWAPNNTGWDSYDDQIYPNVPEPSTYGALLMASALAAFGYQRRRKRQP
jgi:fibronectin-binding autotransporter adhesin